MYEVDAGKTQVDPMVAKLTEIKDELNRQRVRADKAEAEVKRLVNLIGEAHADIIQRPIPSPR